MKKRIWALLLTIAVVLCMSACMKEEKGIEITANGKVKLLSKVSMNEQMINSTYGSVDAFYESATPDLEEDGYKIDNFTEVDDSGATWYGYSATSQPVDKKLAEAALAELMGEDFTVTLTQKGFLVKTVEVYLQYNGAPQEDYQSYGFESYFSIRVPSAISETNGEIGADDNKIARWDIGAVEFGGADPITCTVTYFNMVALLIIVGAVIVVAGAVVAVIVITNSKKKKANAMPFYGAAPQGFGGFDPAQGGFDPAQGGFDPAQGGFDPTQGGFAPNDFGQAPMGPQDGFEQVPSDVQAGFEQAGFEAEAVTENFTGGVNE